MQMEEEFGFALQFCCFENLQMKCQKSLRKSERLLPEG
jgi:hypothetical protein